MWLPWHELLTLMADTMKTPISSEFTGTRVPPQLPVRQRQQR
jgi:hypothetical protein